MFKKTMLTLIAVTTFFCFGLSVKAYDDIPSNSPYFYAIEYLRRNDVFMNTKEFRPDIIISKAEFIKYLVLLNRPDFTPKKTVNLPFEDTKNNAWYAPYFDEAINLGILSDRDQKVEPYKKLTVIDAITLLFHSQSIPIPNVYKGYIPYTDVSRNESVAPMIMRALKFNLIEPERDDFVGIYKRVTRAEAAKMIYKMDLVNLSDPTDSGTVDISGLDIGLQKIISSWDLITSGYVHREDLDQKELSNAAINAMVEMLDDPYSVYLDTEENQAFSDDLSGEVEGIGAFIGVNDKGEVAIISPIGGSPAETAGIKAGDVVKKVDGKDVTSMGLYDIVNLIKGPKGTTVKLTVERDGKTLTISVVRDVIAINALDYEVIENGKVMVVDFYQFNQNAYSQFKEAADIISNSSEIKGLIIDVRDNPGGWLDAVENILNLILEPGKGSVIVKYNDYQYTEYARGPQELKNFPIVVLINNGSASASEILAGALQDYKLATIVGEKSFGKGTVQELNYFSDESSLKLTIAEWLTPLGNSINKNGITPDIKVTDQTGTTTDEQLERGVQELNRLIQLKR